jgi:hypothetical protein
VTSWPPSGARFFNPDPTIRSIALARGEQCLVVDDALADPEGLVQWARAQGFQAPRGYPYPGLVLPAPDDVARRMVDYFAQHLRRPLGVRRVLDLTCRLSLVTVPPDRLEPRQWQCHRDRIAADPRETLFAASVLYLFKEPALGGTSFYVPRKSARETDQMIEDSQLMDAAQFTQRHGVAAGYMSGSNAYFERIASVPAAWNRLIVYDGGLFHSADVERPELLSADAARGRLTLNGFFSCRRNAS